MESNKNLNVPNKGRVPKLRFPGFNGEWNIKLLGEVCEIKTGNKDTQNKIDGGNYPFFVRSNTVERINSYSFDGEAILTSGDGVGVGKNFHYINGKFDFHQRVYSLRNFKNEYSGKFIYNVFSERFYKRVIKLSAKNSVDSVRMDMISKMKIYFPSKLEQTKIASFLSIIDKRISTQNKIIEDYKLLKEGAMQKVFNQELRFKNDKGNYYADWTEKKLGEILKIGSGKDYKHLKPGNIPVYGTGGYMTSVDDFLFEGKSVGIGRKGTIDKPVFLDGKFWTVDTLFYTHSFDNVTPYFVFLLFQRINWLKFNEASGVPSLSKATIEKIKVRIPDLAEQQKISSMLTAIDEKIEVESKQLENLKTQKQFLLQNLFV